VSAPTEPAAGRRIRVTGVVQGVGFRPFVHRLAMRHDLTGSVRNVAGEVQIGIQGTAEHIQHFIDALTREAPPLSHIDGVAVEPATLQPVTAFVIEPSMDPPGLRQPVSPDVAMCATCAAELLDRGNRRYRYPFITCTDCGPRFTVIDAMPYDRERTSMRRFVQCAECAHEYRSPADRRYHSQTNSCLNCGPRLWFAGPFATERMPEGEAALTQAAALLRSDGIVAIRGLGGFHLAVDATSDVAVKLLRLRKNRDAKPLAVMVRTLADAEELVEVSAAAALLLMSPERPVVVLPARPGTTLSPSVAPGLTSVGIMLPSTPLHHLLLGLVRRPLVMTSGNVADEPIATGNEEAQRRLKFIADGFLLHDRDIVSRYDDSVVRPLAHQQIILRRARGLAPLPLTIPVGASRPLLAFGADLKNTFALADGQRAYLSQHVGDLNSLEAIAHFKETLQRFERLFQIAPEVAVRDLHPGYLSTRLAVESGIATILTVQHHHAHIAAVLAEHGETGPAIGVAFDGTGYGDDGNVWGAEVMLADLSEYRRLAHLRYAPMPGGDLAAREPWRAALGYLSLEPALADAFGTAFSGVPERLHALANTQMARHLNAPLASSMGRLFDAASAIIGAHSGRQFEGQAAMELEALAGSRPGRVFDMPLQRQCNEPWVLDPLPLFAALADRRRAGVDPADLAADFHASIIAATSRMVIELCEHYSLPTVGLGGGSFQNARLATMLPMALEARGLRVLQPRRLSPNDGAISYGQAAIAAATIARDAAACPPMGG